MVELREVVLEGSNDVLQLLDIGTQSDGCMNNPD